MADQNAAEQRVQLNIRVDEAPAELAALRQEILALRAQVATLTGGEAAPSAPGTAGIAGTGGLSSGTAPGAPQGQIGAPTDLRLPSGHGDERGGAHAQWLALLPAAAGLAPSAAPQDPMQVSLSYSQQLRAMRDALSLIGSLIAPVPVLRPCTDMALPLEEWLGRVAGAAQRLHSFPMLYCDFFTALVQERLPGFVRSQWDILQADQLPRSLPAFGDWLRRACGLSLDAGRRAAFSALTAGHVRQQARQDVLAFYAYFARMCSLAGVTSERHKMQLFFDGLNLDLQLQCISDGHMRPFTHLGTLPLPGEFPAQGALLPWAVAAQERLRTLAAMNRHVAPQLPAPPGLD